MKKPFHLLFSLFLLLTGCTDKGKEELVPFPVEPPSKEIKLELRTPHIVLSEFIEATGEIVFQCNADWKLDTSFMNQETDWFKLSSTNGSEGENKIIVSTTKENPLYEDRNALIRLTVSDVHENIKITQKKANALLVTQDKLELSNESQVFEIEVKSNVEYEVVIPEESASWIEPFQGTSPRSLETHIEKFSVTPCGEEKREGEIIFTYGEISEKVSIYQSATSVLILVNNEPLTVDHNGAEALEVELRSNIEYDITIPETDQSWINIAEIPGIRAVRSDNIYFKIEKNLTGESRCTQILFKDKNSELSEMLLITQTPEEIQEDTLELSETEIIIDELEQNIEISLYSNKEYDILFFGNSEPNEWIKWVFSNPSLTEPHTITLKAEEYNGNNFREIQLLFQLKDSDVRAIIKIIQKPIARGIFSAEDFLVLAGELNKPVNERDSKILNRYGKYDNATQQWTFIQRNDIRLNPEVRFVPIGYDENPFEDIYDGDKLYMSGVTINGTFKYAGLFGRMASKAIIQNLNLDGSINSSLPDSYTGSLCGFNDGGLLYNVVSSMKIEASGKRSYVGGICGYNSGKIEHGAFHFGNILCVSNETHTGGVTGYNTGELRSSINNGVIQIINQNHSIAGGICGRNNGGYLYGCENQIRIELNSYDYNRGYLGGICGLNMVETSEKKIVLERCYNVGDIKMNHLTYGNAGGICGENANGYIVSCENEGNVSSDFPHYYQNYSNSAGGITGNGSDIIACWNSGEISAGVGGYAGGITGTSRGLMVAHSCFNVGTTSGKYRGGICGSIMGYGRDRNCLWLEGTAEAVSSEYIGSGNHNIGKRTSSEMLKAATELNKGIEEWNSDTSLNNGIRCEHTFMNRSPRYPWIVKR